MLLTLTALLAGCAAAPDAYGPSEAETGLSGPLEPIPEEGKFDETAPRGPRITDGSATEVWAVTHGWDDVSVEAGPAWSANSDLTWEEKYEAWLASFETVARSGYGQTFQISTPHGERSFIAPTLECAEVGYMLRATFAAWYGLPFFIQGWDSHTRQRIFAGHFGFVNSDGERVARFPAFRTRYSDHSGDWSAGQSWPSDERLRGYRLANDDGNPWLGSDAGAGAYFDEIFLNKRVGYFLRLLLLYFGSANLADTANTYHIKPETLRGGDLLLERWQRRGIGHTIPVMRVEAPTPGRLQAWVASGSMPRRQPVWEEPARARNSFTDSSAGGVGESADGEKYAALGGGVRRWRIAARVGGRWSNQVPSTDQSSYLASDDLEAIAARPAQFEELLADVPPEEARDAALAEIEGARMHLRQYPASCSARTRRENAFERLYALMQEHFMTDRATVDATYRTLEDAVLAELDYEASRTCCWNSTTAAMFEIIMSYAEKEQEAALAASMCVQPTVFRAETEGYSRWSAHAASLDRGTEWVAWSEDERCAQRDVSEDTATGRRGGSFCDRDTSAPDTTPTPSDACDEHGANNDPSAATGLAGTLNATLCEGDEDFYRVSAGTTVTIRFSHAAGDLDLEALSLTGERLGSSAGTEDSETVTADQDYIVRVYGYSGAVGDYTIIAE